MSEQDIDLKKTVAELQTAVTRMEWQLSRVRRHLFWMAFYGWLKLVIIFVPLMLGIWYLSPYLSSLNESLGSLRDMATSMRSRGETSDTSLFDDPRVKAFLDSQFQPQ